MPKPYPAAYHCQALALPDEGRTVRDVAARLRVAESCLHRWQRQQRIDQGLISGVSDAERSELAAAKQRIRDLKEEVTILRTAAGLPPVFGPVDLTPWIWPLLMLGKAG